MAAFPAIVRAIGPSALACASASIELDRLLGELGLTPNRFTEWTFKYGAESLGVRPSGETLFPDFPAFSMLAWVDVDPVLMDTDQIQRLVEECDRLILSTKSADVSSQCSRLRALALCALTHQLSLKFDAI